MSEKNLPIKLVLQKASDTQKNQGGGPTMKAYFKRAS